MNYYHHPGAGKGQKDGQGYGQSGNHRQGQSQISPYYPGLHGGFNYGDAPPSTAQISQTTQSSNLLPAVIPPVHNGLSEAGPPAPQPGGFSLANLSKLANFNEIKGFVDRMGGIDGILSTVTKVQKVVSSVSQMAPMVKVLFGSFGKKSISQTDANNSSGRSRRRRRRSGRTGSGRPRSSGGGRRRTRTGRRR